MRPGRRALSAAALTTDSNCSTRSANYLLGSVRAETGGAGRAALAIGDNFPVQFTTQCDVNGCVPRWDNKTDHVRNPGAPLVFEYRWNNDRWETSGEYPYFCDRNNPAVP